MELHFVSTKPILFHFLHHSANQNTSDAPEPYSQSSNTTTLTNSYKGVAHFSETPFVFNNPSFYGPSPQYAALAKQISGFWVNFVNYGNPTPTKNGTIEGVKWEPYYSPWKNGNATYGVNGEMGMKGGNDIVGKIVVMRTEDRGRVVQSWNDWRLAGREFFVKTMGEVYGE